MTIDATETTMTISRLTSAQVAARLGIAPRTVRQLAAHHGIGTLVTPRLRLYSETDVRRLAAISTGKPGRPKRS